MYLLMQSACLRCQPFCFSSNFSTFEFCYFVVAFINLPLRWLIHRLAWMITWDKLAQSTELTHFSKWNQHGKTSQLVSIYKRASSPHVITSIFLKKNVYCYLFISAQFAKHCTYAVSIDNVINTYTIVASLTKELAPVTKSCL